MKRSSSFSSSAASSPSQPNDDHFEDMAEKDEADDRVVVGEGGSESKRRRGSLDGASKTGSGDLVKEIHLQLVPRTKNARNVVSSSGANPWLQYSVWNTTRLSTVLEVTQKKWACGKGKLTVWPVGLRAGEGLSADDISVALQDVYDILGRPDVVKMEYDWRVGKAR